MQALRVEHQKDMQAWIAQYGSDPTSAEAQAALQKLRQEHWNDMRGLFKQFWHQGAGDRGSRRHDGRRERRRLRRSVRQRGCGRRGPGNVGYGGGMMGSGGGMMGGSTY